MYKKIEVHCNSSTTAIYEKASTFVFEKFLSKFIEIDIQQREQLKKIFRKLKQGNGITEDEYSIFFLFLQHKDAERNLNECKKEYLVISEKKQSTVSYESLQTELFTRLIQSRAIDILQKEKYRTPVIEIDGKYFLGIIEEGKQMYFEILENRDGFIICKNLRSGKTLIFEEKTLLMGYSDMGSLIPGDGPFPYTILVNGKILIYKKGAINIEAQDVRYFEDKFFYYIIDGASQNIHRIDKKTYVHVTEGTTNYIFRAQNKKYIIGENRSRRGEFNLFELTGTLKIISEIYDFRESEGNIYIINPDGTEEIFEEYIKKSSFLN